MSAKIETSASRDWDVENFCQDETLVSLNRDHNLLRCHSCSLSSYSSSLKITNRSFLISGTNFLFHYVSLVLVNLLHLAPSSSTLSSSVTPSLFRSKLKTYLFPKLSGHGHFFSRGVWWVFCNKFQRVTKIADLTQFWPSPYFVWLHTTRTVCH